MKKLRPTIDIAMTILLLLLMAYEMVGSVFAELCRTVLGVIIDGEELGPIMHETMGIVFILLVCVHLWLNRGWLLNIFKGKYNAVRTLLVITDILLIVDIIFLSVSGVMMSKIFDLVVDASITESVSDDIGFARTAHLLASYWGFVIMSMHIGFHWRKFSVWLFIPMVYGVWAFIKRQIGEYMCLYTQFVFFDFDEPIAFFLLDYVTIMLLFAGLGFVLMRLCRRMPGENIIK